MKKMMLLMLACIAVLPAAAQSLAELTADGKTAYLEIVMRQGTAPEAYNAAREHLEGNEWGVWAITHNKAESDFTLSILMEKKGFSPFSNSWGGRVHVRVQISDPSGNVLWTSKQHKGNASQYTAFNAMNDAMRKIVRRALKKELRGEK